jgi:hypothetical protein
MNPGMFKIIFKILAGLIFGLWTILTLIVLFFLLDRWTNPGRKGISDVDLMLYAKISLTMLAAAGLLLFISKKIGKVVIRKNKE